MPPLDCTRSDVEGATDGRAIPLQALGLDVGVVGAVVAPHDQELVAPGVVCHGGVDLRNSRVIADDKGAPDRAGRGGGQ